MANISYLMQTSHERFQRLSGPVGLKSQCRANGFEINCQLMVNCCFGARWFGFLGSPKMKGLLLGASQTTNPNQQLTISWNCLSKKQIHTQSSHIWKDWPFSKTNLLSIHSSNLKGKKAIHIIWSHPSSIRPSGRKNILIGQRSVPLPLKLPGWLVWRRQSSYKIYIITSAAQNHHESIWITSFFRWLLRLVWSSRRPRCHSPSVGSGNSIPPARPWELNSIHHSNLKKTYKYRTVYGRCLPFWTCWFKIPISEFRNPANSPVEGLVVEIPFFTTGFSTIQTVVGLGISEPSTAMHFSNRFATLSAFRPLELS